MFGVDFSPVWGRASEAIARHLRPAESLQHLKEVQLAATEGWLFSSSEVEGFLGCKPRVKKGKALAE
ncbi:hypothetical protein [Nostoc sp. FACHB-133]|uniref:hypothetical protein n=1 Tax=Nostoc sp. FACHB-133 TaxID=2692835 RepID=UPI0016894458|nr:hypothetical protein [Nostoc sp. FACHB-133]MBD2527927.1 hypothetical protein [Nostoc sp. FACHB-133]